MTLDEVMETTADALDFGLLPMSAVGQDPGGRLHRYPQPAASTSKRQSMPRSSPRGLARQFRSRRNPATTLHRWRCRQRRLGRAAAHRRRGHQRRSRPDAHRRKVPWANTLEVTRGVEAALDEMRPGFPDIEIDPQIFRPATFIEMSIDNLDQGPAYRLRCSWSWSSAPSSSNGAWR